jgi:hypothetical protein
MTRRLKLLVQGTLWAILILLWVQGSSFCGCGYGCGCGSSHNCAAHTAPLRLPYDSTNYAGPVSPLLTLVMLPEASFTYSPCALMSPGGISTSSMPLPTLHHLAAALTACLPPCHVVSRHHAWSTPSLVACPGLQRLGLGSCGTLSCANEFNAGGASGRDRYSVHGQQHSL